MNKKELKEHIKSIFEKDLNPKPKPKPRPDTEDKLNDELDSTGVIDEPNQGADVEDIQQSLQSAYKKAQGLGDSKLAQQIANTITYFTRNHVLAKQELAEIHRLQELAGIENDTEAFNQSVGQTDDIEL